ncbi:hypothetical protein KAR91_86100 [Candidatus Pacearchaeota archaeon]|nr:hypothetical protein [Candidatus Pacearchaeota archaeon]
MNLIEGLQKELARNRELLKAYEEIPTGAFGAAMIKGSIEIAENAMACGDTVAMLKAYKDLEESE